MLIPILCPTCGRPIGDKAAIFRHLRTELVKETLEKRDTAADQALADGGLQIDCSAILDDLGIETYCCRMHLVTGMEFADYYN